MIMSYARSSFEAHTFVARVRCRASGRGANERSGRGVDDSDAHSDTKVVLTSSGQGLLKYHSSTTTDPSLLPRFLQEETPYSCWTLSGFHSSQGSPFYNKSRRVPDLWI
jgi:hypothetical protein